MSGQSRKQRGKGRSLRPTTADYSQVRYAEVRDRLLTAYEQTDEAEWLVQVGRFVQHCWLAEEAARNGGAFDEMKLWDEWDKCDEAKLRALRSEALVILRDYTRKQHRQRWAALFDAAKERMRPSRWVGWHLSELYRGFLGGVGIVTFGLLIAIGWPQVVRAVRSAVNDLLPAATQPHFANEATPD